MELISYALREDEKSICLLQDAGSDGICQITSLVRRTVPPEFIDTYLYFVPFSSTHAKYKYSGGLKRPFNGRRFEHRPNFITVIDSEAEIKVTEEVMGIMSKRFMPAENPVSYMSYFSDKETCMLLFLRVYRTDQPLDPDYYRQSAKGSSQIVRLYNGDGSMAELPVSGISPVISDSVFRKRKDEILLELRAKDAVVNIYDRADEKSMARLAKRSAAEKEDFYRTRRESLRKSQESGIFNGDYDLARVDYETVYRSALEACPAMEGIIDYIRGIQPARHGEYKYLINEIKKDSFLSGEIAAARIFEMNLRVALKYAVYRYQKYGADIEDVFQEACIGLMLALERFDPESPSGFHNYARMLIMSIVNRRASVINRYLSVSERDKDEVRRIVRNTGILGDGFEEMCRELKAGEGYSDEESMRIAGLLAGCEDIYEILDDPEKELSIGAEADISDGIIRHIPDRGLEQAMQSLKKREREVLEYRFGFKTGEEMTLEEISVIYGLTRERIRQIEKKARKKILFYYRRAGWITEEKCRDVVERLYAGKKK